MIFSHSSPPRSLRQTDVNEFLTLCASGVFRAAIHASSKIDEGLQAAVLDDQGIVSREDVERLAVSLTKP